ncbi:MAG TPA: hypothetical protein VJN20_09990 [Burkholderiales bacterium]|nr:hypothetical protein [Burkholderiales bacterium]
MSERMKAALAKLLDGYDTRRSDDQAREQKAKDDEARFLKDFAELRQQVIRPVFEDAGALLEARGHRYSIGEQEFTPGSAGAINEAGITLRIVPSGTKAPLHEDQRSLTIATRHYNRTVWINSGEAPGAGGLAGAKGSLALDRVTRELVEDEVIAFVGRVVAR